MDKHILIVDDEQDVLDLIENQLTSTGYKVQRAMNGVQALGKLKGASFDLILIDIVMPDMDGFALFKELKKTDATAEIPVLVLSARGKMQDTFLAMGANGFISKPFDPNQLLEQVNASLGIAGGESDGTSTVEPEKKKPAVTVAPSEPKITEGDQKKILIVGESQKVMGKMQKLLEEKGCFVAQCTEGKEVLAHYSREPSDVLIVEVIMKGVLVHEMIRRLRKQPNFGDRPIILFSCLDKDNLDGESVPQRTLKIENARTICVEAGATLSTGGFEADKFIPMIEEYLSAK